MPADFNPSNLHIVVLAAGKGTRMKSALPKVLHHAAGLPLIDRVLASAEPLAPESVTIIIGHQTEILEAHLADAVSRQRYRSRSSEPGMPSSRQNLS